VPYNEDLMNMRVLLLNNKMLVLIFCLGFILRLFFALNSNTPTIKDGVLYDSIAMSLINGKGYTIDSQHPTSQVAPFYPFFLAVIYTIFGYNLKAALILQAIIGIITCLLIYKLAMEIFKDRNVAIISGIISSLYYYFIREGERLWTETLFMFILVLVILYYVKMITYLNPLYASITGLLSAALTLTRPIALFLPFILMGVDFFMIYRWNRQRLFTYMRYLIMVLFFFLLPVSLWTIRNLVVQKEFVLVATGGGRNFY
jgi:4-amino-4-deoxy-L-arabinose transferase-like glycosyltransferase